MYGPLGRGGEMGRWGLDEGPSSDGKYQSDSQYLVPDEGAEGRRNNRLFSSPVLQAEADMSGEAR